MKFYNNIIIRYYILIVTTLLTFILASFIGYQYLIKNIFPEEKMSAPLFIAKLIDHLGKQNKLAGIQKYLRLKGDGIGPNLELIDAQGHVINPSNHPSERATTHDFQSLKKPYDYTLLNFPPVIRITHPRW